MTLAAKTSNDKLVKERWKKYKLPSDLSKQTFLDVGTWAGGFCKEARKLGVDDVLGIDMVAPQAEDFNFLQCDVFSNKFLELKVFDIVFCAGVLYHVEDVVGFLIRLKLKTGKLLVLETEITEQDTGPVMSFCPNNSFKDNHSNWWVPSVSCVVEMLKACGFKDIKVVWSTENRACFHATPENITCEKILPRREEAMRI